MTEIVDAELKLHSLLSSKLTHLKNYSLHISSGKSKGDGYAGEIWRVKVQHENGEIHLVVKSAENDEKKRNFIKTDALYRAEVNFYTKIFPVLDRFQREKQVKRPFEITKCYGTSLKEKEEALVLEDLRAAGFDLCNRKKPLDEDHISLVLKRYGKLHALSFALRDQQPEIFQEIVANSTDVYPLIYPSMRDGLLAQIQSNAEMLKHEGLLEESELAQNVAEQLDEIFLMSCEPEYSVVTHGDCWSNNMMFKYDDKTGKPIEHRFIDFQISRLHSPAFDLAYFLCTSAPKHIIDELEKYLKMYYDSLSCFLKELGSDPDVVFPFNVFMRHWKKHRKFGLVMALFAFRFILAEEDEIVVLTPEDFHQTLCTTISSKEYDQRVINVIKHFVESDST